jgi:hypothetical protein
MIVQNNFSVSFQHSQCCYLPPTINLFFRASLSDAEDTNYKDRGKRDAEEDVLVVGNRDERQFQTRLFGDVEVVVKGTSSKMRERGI